MSVYKHPVLTPIETKTKVKKEKKKAVEMIKFIEDSGMDETEEIQKSVKDLHASKSQRHNFDPTTART
jgi:hypothetical protein